MLSIMVGHAVSPRLIWFSNPIYLDEAEVIDNIKIVIGKDTGIVKGRVIDEYELPISNANIIGYVENHCCPKTDRNRLSGLKEPV